MAAKARPPVIDVRYMGLTLIAVFLALAIGMMTGSALGGPDKRDAAYQGLRSEFELLRAENQRVREENDQVRRRLNASDQAMRELLPLAVKDRIPGSTVGVILCGGIREGAFWTDLESALQTAGAEIGPIIRVPDRMQPPQPDTRQRFLFLQNEAERTDDPFEAAGWMVRLIARGAGPQRRDALAQETGVEVRAPRPERPISRFLLLTTVADDLRAGNLAAGAIPELDIVDAARAEHARIVAAEPQDTKGSVVDLLRRRGVTTVDDIDTAAGQISAVLALAGAEGQFGTTPGATRAIAPLPSP